MQLEALPGVVKDRNARPGAPYPTNGVLQTQEVIGGTGAVPMATMAWLMSQLPCAKAVPSTMNKYEANTNYVGQYVAMFSLIIMFLAIGAAVLAMWRLRRRIDKSEEDIRILAKALNQQKLENETLRRAEDNYRHELQSYQRTVGTMSQVTYARHRVQPRFVVIAQELEHGAFVESHEVN